MSAPDSADKLYGYLLAHVFNLLCGALEECTSQGTLQEHLASELAIRLGRLYKEMNTLEKQAQEPEQLGLSCFFSWPIRKLLLRLQERPVP